MLTLDLDHVRGDFRLTLQAELPGPVTGICGPSGAGKSTLLALIAGLLTPARGRIVLDGRVLTDTASGIAVPPHARGVGIVFQDARLFPHLTVQRNLLYGYRRCPPAQRRFAPTAMIELLEIGHLLDRLPHTLSGGERQRVALGRAVLGSPRLLLLDEPLAALDGRLKAQLLPFLARLHAHTGLPVCHVSHDMAELRRLADRILYLRDGTLGAPVSAPG